MTTPNEELIARLRDRATFLGPELTLAILPEAADLLQSQAERIATLEGDVEYLQKDIDAMCNAIPDYRWSGGAAELIAKCFADRDTLRAELADAELHTKQVERGTCPCAAAPAPVAQHSQYGSEDLQALILAKLTAPQAQEPARNVTKEEDAILRGALLRSGTVIHPKPVPQPAQGGQHE